MSSSNDISTRREHLSPAKRALLERWSRGQHASAQQVIPQRSVYSPVAPSFAQERMWFLDQLGQGSAFYNIASATRLSGPLDVVVLKRSLNEIVRRQAILRTVFAREAEQPMQVIESAVALALPVLDLVALPEARREIAAHRQAVAEAQRMFDLARGPLLRVMLLRLAMQEHVLLVTMHHIISDGWSDTILLHELTRIYDAFIDDRPASLPDLPIQYADYAVWQRAWLQGDILETQVAYWRAQLASATFVLELPTDRPRPAVQTFRGAIHAFRLPASLTADLKSLGQRDNVTLFMILLAAWQVLLHRYSGQDDILVGSPSAGRTRPETGGLIGCFVNTLVFRAQLAGDPSFRVVLRQVREAALGAYAHQDVPFERLVEELQPERDLSRNPLFQVMFVLQNAPQSVPRFGDVTLSPLEAHGGTSKFDLTLSIRETEHGLAGFLEYSTDLFDAATVARMSGHLQTLLTGIAAAPEQRLAYLPILTQAEQRCMLQEWNATERPNPATCIHLMVEARVASAPDAVAVRYGEAQLTCAQLNARANQLARHLRDLGVGPDILVGLCVERSFDLVVGILGILKAGGAYVPLDPSYPTERLAFMLEDTQAPVLVTQRRLLSHVPGIADRRRERATAAAPASADPQVLCLDDLPIPPADPRPFAAAPGLSPERLAYVIYTSGSTGRPKGVALPHRGVVNFIVSTTTLFDVTPDDVMLQFSTFCFDVSVFEIFTALCAGARLILISRETALSPPALTALMQREEVTIVDIPPVVLALLPADAFPAIRIALIGGESFTGELATDWQRSGRRFFNGYGPTESTVTMILLECQGVYAEPPPIGRPMPNHQAYVLDAHQQPVPIGVPAELYISGAGLAHGYLRRPDLTADRFIPNPFAQGSRVWGLGSAARDQEVAPEPRTLNPEPRLYRTGDLVRYLPDGVIQFLGRVDQQVKIRGYRIELGEIEAVLNQHPAIQQAVVAVDEKTSTAKRLVAYILAYDGLSPSASELRNWLSRKLPGYMIPSVFVQLSSLPLSPSGKIDRAALPKPSPFSHNSDDGYIAPRTDLEERLARLFAEALDIDRVGIHDNFFELGGNSLQIAKVQSRLMSVLQIQTPLHVIFRGPTIAQLSEYIETTPEYRRQMDRSDDGAHKALPGQSPIGATSAPPPIPPAPRDQPIPLSYAQQRMWLRSRSLPQSALVNRPLAVRLAGALNIAALDQSLGALVQRHEILRTTFGQIAGRPAQVIAPTLRIAALIIILDGLSKDEREANVQRIAMAEVKRPFDLARGPLIRVHLLRLSEREHVLLTTMHPIVWDGFSRGVFLRELAALYQANCTGQRAQLPALPVQYADYAAWQRAWLQGAVLHDHLRYWKRRLTGAPDALDLPLDHPRPPAQSFRGMHLIFQLSQDLTEELEAFSRQERATRYVTLLTAFQIMLYSYTGQHDIVIGTPVANRPRDEIQGLIGLFVNTVALRLDSSSDPSIQELVARVRAVTLDAYAHQDAPLDQVIEAVSPIRKPDRHTLFQVAFDLVEAPIVSLDMVGLTFGPLTVENRTSEFDLTLTLEKTPSGLRAALGYSTDLFEAETMERFAERYQAILRAIATNPRQRLSELLRLIV